MGRKYLFSCSISDPWRLLFPPKHRQIRGWTVQSPIFLLQCQDRALTSMGSHLGFICTEGADITVLRQWGEGGKSNSRWPTVMQSLRSQRSYGKIGAYEQSNNVRGGAGPPFSTSVSFLQNVTFRTSFFQSTH